MKAKIITLAVTILMSASLVMAGGNGEITSEKDIKKKKMKDTINTINNDVFTNTAEVVVIDANNATLCNAIPDDTRNSINKEVSYPEFARDNQEEGMVIVSFTYNEDGYIEILSSNASDQKFNDYIISKLEKIRLKYGSVTIGKAYNAIFHFKLL